MNRLKVLKQIREEMKVMLVRNEWGMRCLQKGSKKKMFHESQITEMMAKLDVQRVQIVNDLETIREMIKEEEYGTPTKH